MTKARTAAIALLAAAATAASADDQIFVGGPAGAVYVADSDTGEFTYFACFCIGPIVSIQPLGSDLLVADSFGGLWQLDGVTGVFETGVWTGLQLVDMVVDGDDALVVTNSGELKRVSLDSGFPTETIPTPEPASSVATFDGRTYVGTTLGGVFSSDDNLEWGLTRYMTASIKTLSPRPEGLIIVDSAGQASVFDWLSGPDTGYYVSPDTVDAAYTGNFNLFTQAPGAVDVFAADTLLLVDTWTLPVEASAIFVRPGNVCKADTNRNGVLEAGDFSAWVAAYNRGDFIADQNNDLAVTPADFSAWVSAFNLGCD